MDKRVVGCQSNFIPTSGQEQLNLDKTLFGCGDTCLFIKTVSNNSSTASRAACSKAFILLLCFEKPSNVRLVIFVCLFSLL